MRARAKAVPGSAPGGLHLQVSRLLIHCVIIAVAATGALGVTLLVAFPAQPGPPPGIPGVPPGPPPDVRGVVALVVVTGLFVLAWLAVLVVYARDQILRGLAGDRGEAMDPGRMRELLDEVRAELAADREREWQVISERLAEYGEQRETDGYLSGMRVATGAQPKEANVRSIRRPPAQR